MPAFFKNSKELYLELEPPSLDIPYQVYEGLPGYDPELGPTSVLTGKVIFPATKPCKDVESLVLTFIGTIHIDTQKLSDAVSGKSSDLLEDTDFEEREDQIEECTNEKDIWKRSRMNTKAKTNSVDTGHQDTQISDIEAIRVKGSQDNYGENKIKEEYDMEFDSDDEDDEEDLIEETAISRMSVISQKDFDHKLNYEGRHFQSVKSQESLSVVSTAKKKDVFSRVVVKEQLVLFKLAQPSTLPPQRYEWKFAMHMCKHAHLPSSVETNIGKVHYNVEAHLIRKNKPHSLKCRSLFVSKPITLSRYRPLSLIQTGIKIAKGVSLEHGLFSYEAQVPKEMYADGKDVRIILKLQALDISKVNDITDVECSLKEERIYSILDSNAPSELATRKISQEGFIGKSIRYKETVRNSLLSDQSNKSYNTGHRERRTALVSAILSSSAADYRIMTFQLPVSGAIPDMALEEMTVRHAIHFQIEFILNEDDHTTRELTESFDIPLPMYLGGSAINSTTQLREEINSNNLNNILAPNLMNSFPKSASLNSLTKITSIEND